MANLKERIKVWKDYIEENHNQNIKESLEGVDDEDFDDARKDLFDFIQIHLSYLQYYLKN